MGEFDWPKVGEFEVAIGVHTCKAIQPSDSKTFHRLIRNTVAITIATEAGCVEEEWLDDDDRMNAEELLAELLAHIDKAL